MSNITTLTKEEVNLPYDGANDGTENDSKITDMSTDNDYVFIPNQEKLSCQDPLESCCSQLENINKYDLQVYNYNELIISHAKYILSTSPNTEELTGIRRIFHILNTFLRNFEIDTIYKKKQFIDIITSITYCAPWDEEHVIFYQLDKLCTFLLNHYPNDNKIEKIITEDIKKITILDEISEILNLTINI